MTTLCKTARLVKYTELQARLEAQSTRRHAQPDSPRAEASYKRCKSCKGWHVHIPEVRANPVGKKPRT